MCRAYAFDCVDKLAPFGLTTNILFFLRLLLACPCTSISKIEKKQCDRADGKLLTCATLGYIVRESSECG